MKRFAFKMKLNPDCVDEYHRRHAEIWPEIVKLLKESGVSNYSIFFDEETSLLFAYQEQGEVSSQDLGNEPIIQKWWDYMADIMLTNPDHSPVSIPLKEVFYMK